jgi:hypothetical protein
MKQMMPEMRETGEMSTNTQDDEGEPRLRADTQDEVRRRGKSLLRSTVATDKYIY